MKLRVWGPHDPTTLGSQANRDAVTAWLAEHGVDTKQVKAVLDDTYYGVTCRPCLVALGAHPLATEVPELLRKS